jgi:chemotaxis protein CheZ
MLPADEKQKYRGHLERMLSLLDANEDDIFQQELDVWINTHQQHLHQELGRMAREVHESLNSFRLDPRLMDLAEKEVPQAQDRLHYVINLTQQAANRTMDLIESNMPRTEQLRQRAENLEGRWHRFCRRDMQINEFRPLAEEMGVFLGNAVTEVNQLRCDLSEILVAQSFQDLSGQMIKRVIVFMEELEKGLLNLVCLSGPRSEGSGTSASRQGVDVVDPSSDQAQVSGQDEVDDLLSELGF